MILQASVSKTTAAAEPQNQLKQNQKDLVAQHIVNGSVIAYHFKDPEGKESGWRVGKVTGFAEDYSVFYNKGDADPAKAKYIGINQLGYGKGSTWIKLATNISGMQQLNPSDKVEIEIELKDGRKISGTFSGVNFTLTDELEYVDSKTKETREVDGNEILKIIAKAPLVHDNPRPYASKSYYTFSDTISRTPGDTGFYKPAKDMLEQDNPQEIKRKFEAKKDRRGGNLWTDVLRLSSETGVQKSWIFATIISENSGLNERSKNGADLGIMQMRETNYKEFKKKTYNDDLALLIQKNSIDANGLAAFLGIKKWKASWDAGKKAEALVSNLTGGKSAQADLFDMRKNLTLGVLFTRMNLDRFNHSFELAAWAYNGGRTLVVEYLNNKDAEAIAKGTEYATKVSSYQYYFEQHFGK